MNHDVPTGHLCTKSVKVKGLLPVVLIFNELGQSVDPRSPFWKVGLQHKVSSPWTPIGSQAELDRNITALFLSIYTAYFVILKNRLLRAEGISPLNNECLHIVLWLL